MRITVTEAKKKCGCRIDRATSPGRPGQIVFCPIHDAAPELLAALQALVAADNCNYERDAMRSEGYFEAARAALAKAQGVTA